MFAWLIAKVAKPVLPVLLQSYKVVVMVESTLKMVIVKVGELGIPEGTPIYKNLKMVLDAVTAIKEALAKAIKFLGGEVPMAASLANSDLEEEIDKLKKLL